MHLQLLQLLESVYHLKDIVWREISSADGDAGEESPSLLRYEPL